MSLKSCAWLSLNIFNYKLTPKIIAYPNYIYCSQQIIRHFRVCNCTDFQSIPASDVKKVQQQQPKNSFKHIYYAPLTPQIKAVKVFSLSTSIMGILSQPILYKEIVSTGNLSVIIASYTFFGFFTLVMPLILHTITKKYVTNVFYNDDTETFRANTVNFFCRTKHTDFRAEDVYVPDVPGMFTTLKINGKALFVDGQLFIYPEYYRKIMGYDKPMDFKLHKPEATTHNIDKNKN